MFLNSCHFSCETADCFSATLVITVLYCVWVWFGSKIRENWGITNRELGTGNREPGLKPDEETGIPKSSLITIFQSLIPNPYFPFPNPQFLFSTLAAMKKLILPVLLLSLWGCNSSTPENQTPVADTAKKDSVVMAQVFYVEDLLQIKDEAELKLKYPQSKITYDTIWGSEGAFTMGTYIDKGSKDEVQIMWKDSAK